MKKITRLKKPLRGPYFLLLVILLSVNNLVAAAPSLIDVYHLAKEHDATLAQSQAKYEADKQVIVTARSPFLPQIKADGTYGITDSSMNLGDVTTQNISIVVNQSLYNHENIARYNQAQYKLQQSSYVMQSAKQDLILRVVEIYFSVLLAQEDMELAIAQKKADKTQWQRAETSAELGLSSKTDVLQAKSIYDLSRAELISTKNNLDIAYERLIMLTGQSLGELKTVALDIVLPRNKLNIYQLEAKAKLNNLTVLRLEQSANIASQEIEVQKSGHWFNVGIQANYTKTVFSGYNQASAGRFNDKNDLYIGAYISLPIYSGGRVSSQVSEARAHLRSNHAGLRNAREQAGLDARVQVRNIKKGLALVDALREAVKSNDAFLEAAEEGNRVGLKSLLEVLSARTNKFKAHRNLTESLHGVILSSLKLEAAVGDLTVEDLMKYNVLLSSPVL